MSLQRRNSGSNIPRPSPNNNTENVRHTQGNGGMPMPNDPRFDEEPNQGGQQPNGMSMPSPSMGYGRSMPNPSQGYASNGYDDPRYDGQYGNTPSQGRPQQYDRFNDPSQGHGYGQQNTGHPQDNGYDQRPTSSSYGAPSSSYDTPMSQGGGRGFQTPGGNQGFDSMGGQPAGDGYNDITPGLDDYDVDDDANYDVSFDDDLSSDPTGLAPSGNDDPNADDGDDEEFSDEEVHEYLAPKEAKQKKISKKAEDKRQAEDNQESRRSRKSKLGDKSQDKKNQAQTAKTVRIAVLVGLAIIVLIGLYQCLAPKHEWSANEISSISKQANGDTGFPMQEGAGVAQQFIEAYLQSTDASSRKILNMFYNGIDFSKANDSSSESVGGGSGLQVPSNVRQVIKAGPYLYEQLATGPNGDSASYKFGALVYRVNTEDNKAIVGKNGKDPDFRWMFYQVDVHYDKTTNRFVISKNSPVRVPEPKTQDVSSIPEYTLPGNGEEVEGLDQDAMQNLITTFFKAWAKSDKASMVNITDSSSLPSVYDGLDDLVIIDGNGDPSFKIYGPPKTDPYYRALVTVNWRENVGGKGDGYVQTSMYVLKLKKQGNKFIVVDVQPYKYIPYVDPTSSNATTPAKEESDSGDDSEASK